MSTPPQFRQEPELRRQPGRPREIDTAVGLWCATLALHLIGVVVRTFSVPETVRAQLRVQAERAGYGDNERMLHETMVLTQVVMVVVAVLACTAWALIVLRMRAGRGWARATLAVLGWVSLVFVAPMVVSDQPATVLFYGATIGVELGAIMTMYRPKANEYFAASGNGPTNEQ